MRKHRSWPLALSILVLFVLPEISQTATTVVSDESISISQMSRKVAPSQASSSSSSSSSSTSSHAMSTISSSSSSSSSSEFKIEDISESRDGEPVIEMNEAESSTESLLGSKFADTLQQNPRADSDITNDHSTQGLQLLNNESNNFTSDIEAISHSSVASQQEQTTEHTMPLDIEEPSTTFGPVLTDKPMLWIATSDSQSTVPTFQVSKIHQTTESMQHFPVSPIKKFYELTKEYFQWKLKEFPQSTTRIGVNDASNGHLDRFSDVLFEQRKLACEDFLKRGQAIDTSTFSEEDILNYNLYIYDINTYLQNYKYLKFFAPISFLEGPQNNLLRTLKETTLNTYNDYLKLISRLSEFPRQANEIISIMNGSISSGLMPSNWSLNGVIDQFDNLLVPYNASVFYQPFLDIKLNISNEKKKNLKRLALEPVKKMISAFKRVRDFLESDYLPATRPLEGVASLPGGEEFYQACLKFHTSTDMTPQQIHELGLAEAIRIKKEVAQTAIELGIPNKTLTEINAIIREDLTQRFESKENLLNTYKSAVYNDIYPLMNLIVNDIPNVNVSVEESVGGSMYASYSNAPIDNSRPGTFYINTKIYKSHKRYEVNALSLHEAVPGHHLQAIVLMRNPSVPDFRKFPGYYRFGDVPAKFPLHTAFAEGWGLYSEYLGNELGLYKDPYQRYGRHSLELLRACRLVVDTGIHSLKWTRQQAIDYLLENTAMSKEAVGNEIDRYISRPGQACAYKIGEIKIKELRERAESSLGHLFRLQDFHEVVLGCGGPLDILQECVERYILKLLDSS